MSASNDHSWRRRAACIGADGSVFFPEPHQPDHDQRLATAKAICGGCPVVEPCRRWAISHRGELGVWGGLTETERRAIRRAAHGETAA